jgi:hypothetical protein
MDNIQKNDHSINMNFATDFSDRNTRIILQHPVALCKSKLMARSGTQSYIDLKPLR